MAVQKSKKSKSKKLQKRAHQSLSNPTLSTDPVTGERHLRHQMTADGFYRGKKIVEIKLEEKEKENFEISTKAVKELFEAAIKIDPSLAK